MNNYERWFLNKFFPTVRRCELYMRKYFGTNESHGNGTRIAYGGIYKCIISKHKLKEHILNLQK